MNSLCSASTANPKTRKGIDNMDAQALLARRKSRKSGALLKGADAPATVKSIKIEIAEVREAPPGFDAPAICGLKKPIYDRTALAVNQTNLQLLIALLGADTDKWVGKTVRLDLVPMTNPKTGAIVRSLIVSPKQ
jgi:hypothetical protein